MDVDTNYFKSIVKILVVLLIFSQASYSQQITIPRVDMMPDFPSPFLMRNWDDVAIGYDALVFNTESTGTHFPLVSIGSSGNNYPEINRIKMDSYVGWSGTHGEAINVIPAIVGATLMGIDKSAQNGANWVSSSKDYFNQANGQNIYLNGSSSSTGGDWWYETMPNVFFYQMFDLYPDQPDFNEQFKLVADRWLEAVQAMGGSSTPWQMPNMNYRAWNFSTMQGLEQGVKEPEAAGAIAWILYHAYTELGDVKYLQGARQALDFLNEWEDNPSYELQLPYGVLAAAKLNAAHGANYDLDKMINWCFDRGALRGWGTIVGTWDGNDISGVIGEANDGGNDYAFAMNGFQQVSALAPMVKYDKRYAKAIAKWVLNVSNASRFFYSKYVTENHQSDFAWSTANDPDSYIAYESLKESWNGEALYARGDSKDAGWAETNLGLYGSSHVGYLAAVVDMTDVEGILDLNLNATDFLTSRENPVHLFYNPYKSPKQVNINVGGQSVDIYDAISEQVIKTGVSGDIQVDINANEVLLLTYVPTGSILYGHAGKLWLNDVVVDYHYGYDFDPKLEFKSLAAKKTVGEVSVENQLHATVESNNEAVTYAWFVNDIEQVGNSNLQTWTPNAKGLYKILCVASTATSSVKDSLEIVVLDIVPAPPVIERFEWDKSWYNPGELATVDCIASDPKNQELTYGWTVNQGSVVAVDGSKMTYLLPENAGVFQITCIVSNSFDLSTMEDTQVFSSQNSKTKVDSLIYMPMNGSTDLYSPNNYTLEESGISFSTDPKGVIDFAVELNSSSDLLTINNEESLQFGEQITVAFWLNLSASLNEEQFVVSHGSWLNRWKVSIIPNGKLRWTINTSSAITDLDTKLPLEINQFYHVAVVYTGNGMAIYLDGELDNFGSAIGTINSTSSGISIGRPLPFDDKHTLRGIVDELKIFNKALGPDAVSILPTIWTDDIGVISSIEISVKEDDLWIYPNPSVGGVFKVGHFATGINELLSLRIYNLQGQMMYNALASDLERKQVNANLSSGLYLIKFETHAAIISKKLIVE